MIAATAVHGLPSMKPLQTRKCLSKIFIRKTNGTCFKKNIYRCGRSFGCSRSNERRDYCKCLRDGATKFQVAFPRNTIARPKPARRFGPVITHSGLMITRSGTVITHFGNVITRFGNAQK